MSEAIRATEFEFSDAAFGKIKSLLKQRSGIDLGDAKRMLVYGRLARRLRALSLTSFSEYLPLIDDAESDEAKNFLNALTTNVTEFFRESHHFEFLTQRVLPETQTRRGQRKLRVWSAGCSTGEEPYSIAITLAMAGGAEDWDTKVLATDIDSDVLDHAQRGVYTLDKLGKLSQAQLRYFQRGTGANSQLARVKPELKELIAFKQLNLLGQWQMQGPFDVIFCRNVVIYFDVATRERLVRRFASLLMPGGYLFMGHSESLTANSLRELEPCGKTAYRRTEGS